MTELKPCPFCGEGSVSVGWDDFDSGVIFFECDTCGMYCEPKDCYANEPKAIQAWNTRTERTCKLGAEVTAFTITLNMLADIPWYWCMECGAATPSISNYCMHCGAKVVS